MTQKNPSWVEFSDDVWGEAVGPTEHDKFLDSLDGPTLPIQSLGLLPDHDAPLRQVWIVKHVAELVEDERSRVIGPHGRTFKEHSDMMMEVANLDAARRTAVGDLRDQLTRQIREARQELGDFERSDRFQKALRHYFEAAGPAFERMAASTPENPAAVLFQQQAVIRWNGLQSKLISSDEFPSQSVEELVASDSGAQVVGDKEPMLRKGINPRKDVETWVAWWAYQIARDKRDLTKDCIVGEILKKAERFGYQSNNGSLSQMSILRMIPSGLTGGRGRKPGSQSKK